MGNRSKRNQSKTSNWAYLSLSYFLNSERTFRRHPRDIGRSARLLVTQLEDRITPTTLHWLGNSASNGNLWSVASNWFEDQAPVSGDTLVFDTTIPEFSATTNGFSPTNDIPGLTDLAIEINNSSSAGDFTISGDAFGLITTDGVGINCTLSAGTSSSAAEAINNDITLGANTTVDVGLGSLTLGGVISGGYSLIAAGSPSSTLTLNAANTYSGGTTLTSGILALNTDTSLGTSTLTFNGGTLTDVGSFLHIPNDFVVAAPSTIGGGGFFNLNGDGTLNATLTLDNSGFLALDGALSGTGGLSEIGFPGGTTLGGTTPNTFTGGVSILSGGITLDKTPGVNAVVSPITVAKSFTSLTLDASDQINDNATVYLGQGASFSTNGYSDTVASLTGLGTLSTGSTTSAGLTVTGGGNQLLTGVVSGAGYVAYDGTGSLTLAGTSSSYTGALTASGGSLIIDANFSEATAAVDGGTLGGTGIVESINATSGVINPATAGVGGILNTANSSAASAFNGATFTADLASQGPSDELALGANATLSLNGANLTLNAIGSTFAKSYQIITSPTGGITGTFNGLPNGSTISVGSQNFQINYTSDAVTLTNLGSGSTTLYWTGAVSSNWNAAGNWEEDAIPASGDTLVFDTSAPGFAATSAAFAPTNNQSGLTNISLVFNDNSSAGDFVLSGNSLGLASTAGVGIASALATGSTVTIDTALSLAANTTIDLGLGDLTLSGMVSGSHALIVTGSQEGTLILNEANTYSGGTQLVSGTVEVNTNTSLGTGTITLNGGTLANATAFLNVANAFTVSSLSTIGGGSFFNLTGNGVLNANVRLTNSGFLTLSGAISGTGGLIEDGFPGGTTLSGSSANTFTGQTTILTGGITLDKAAGVNAIESPTLIDYDSLSWDANDQLNGKVSIDLGIGGSLSTSYSDTLPSLTGIGGVTDSSTSGIGLVVNGSGAMLYTGEVSGSGILAYDGSGSLALGGTSSSFTGQLEAEAGALLVDANFSKATAFAKGSGTLGGAGMVDELASGTSAINPGGSGAGGILTTAAGSNSSAINGETFQVDINGNALSDEIVIGASATISLASSTLSVNVLQSTAGSIYTIIASPSGGISGTFTGLSNGSTFSADGREFRINYTTTAVTLTDLQAISLPSSLPEGEAGVAYDQTITPTGGSPPVTLTVSSIKNADGLTISGSGTGEVSVIGVPTSSGTVTFTVTPSDANGLEAATNYSIILNAPVVLTPASLPAGEVGIAYNRAINFTGGTAPVTLGVSNVTNTTGLTISGSGTGAISLNGTPTSAGTVTFTVTPADAYGTGTSKVYSIIINPAVILSPATLPAGEVSIAYSQRISPTGGVGPYTLAVSGVTNTTGLTISGSGTGAISVSGTPAFGGIVTFTVTPTDAIGAQPGTVYSFVVNSPVLLSPSTLPAGEVGLVYNQSITGSGGSGSITLVASAITNTTGLSISGSGTGTISFTGTPTSAGTVSFTITPVDGIGTGPGKTYSFTVKPPVTLSPATLPGGDVGVAYNQAITGSGGSGAIALVASGITNTTGLSISGSGTGTIGLSGTPTSTGTVSFTVTPSDAIGTGAGADYSFTVSPPLTLNTSTLPSGEVAVLYSQTLATSGGTEPITFSVSAGNLPQGLSLDTSTGAITGTPTTTNGNPFSFTITATDAAGGSTSQAYTTPIIAAPAITILSLPNWTINQPYSQTIATSGGTTPITFSVSAGSLPPGLSLNSGTGEITGTPSTTTGNPFNFTIAATDEKGGSASRAYTVLIAAQPSITTPSLPDWTVNQPYSQTIAISGGTAPITFSVSAGVLPLGLSLNSGTGAIAGTPSTTSGSPFSFRITAIDAAGASASQAYSVTINTPPTITTTSLPNGEVAILYNQPVATSGGTAPITFSVSAGSLPPGLSLNSGTGAITGMPSTDGPFNFTIAATDSAGASASQGYSVAIDAPPMITTTNGTTFTVGTGSSFLVTASGYPAPTFSESGALPDGVSFNAAGLLTGTPTDGTGGVYPIVITATNGFSPDATEDFTLTVNQAPAVTSSNSISFTVDQSSSFSATASGYPAPTFAESGTLPDGVTFASAGVLGGTPAAGTGGAYPIVITATNGVAPDATQDFTLTIDQPPLVTSSNSTTFTVGVAGSFSVTASGYPAPAFSESGALPEGVSFSPAGLLSGTPAAGTGGVYPIVITATNGVSPDASQDFTLTCNPYSLSESIPSVSSGSVQSSSTTTISLQTKDGFGNNLTSGGLTVAFALASANGGDGLFSDASYQGNGLYQATFTGTIAGSNTITATINGQSVTSIAPSIAITPGPVDPANSRVTVSEPNIQLGGASTLTLQARDAYGNDVNTGGMKIVFTLANKSGASGTISKVTDNKNGTYTATFTGSLDSSNSIVATANGTAVTSSAPISVSGAAYSTARSALTLSSSSIVAGNSTTITLQVEDAKGNQETAGGLKVTFALAGGGGRGTFSTVTDHDNGTYSATFTGTLAGTNTIKAFIDGRAVTSKAPSITVETGPLSLATSPLTLSAATMKAGNTITVTLQPEDAGGNKLLLPGEIVTFVLENGQGTFNSMTYNPKTGAYSETLTTTTSGSYTIASTINDQSVTSTSPELSVTPAKANPANSFVSVSADTVEAGSPITVTLHAVDQYDNPETTGGLAVAFILGSGDGKGTFSAVKDNKNGIYTATFVGATAGANSIGATIDGSKVTSALPTITVIPGAVSLTKSVVTLSASTVSVGGTITVTLQAKDAYGNDETSGGLPVLFLLGSTGGGQGTFGSVTDNGNGTYTAIFTATEVGSNTIKVTINGVLLTLAPPKIKVVAS